MLSAVATIASKVGFQLVKKAPVILAIASGASSVGAVAFAIKDTPKAMEDLKADKEVIDEIKYRYTAPEYEKSREEVGYNKTAYTKDVAVHTFKLLGHLAKNYWKTILLEALAITCGLAAFKIISARYVAATALANGLNKTLTEYRQRVAKKIGKEAEEDLFLGREALPKGAKDANGNDISGQKTTAGAPSGYSFSRVFGPVGCPGGGSSLWKDNPEMNKFAIKSVREYFNNQLRAGHVVIINDVYRRLGMQECPEGQFAGWSPDGTDQEIDFGIDLNPNIPNTKDIDYIIHDGEYVPVFNLVFNIDGLVYDKLNEYEKAVG